MYEYSHMGGFGIGMGLFWLLVFAAIVWLVVSMIGKRGPDSTGINGETPLDILRKRYASGEIDDAEYQAKKHLLEEK
jgi:putative membrane protein